MSSFKTFCAAVFLSVLSLVICIAPASGQVFISTIPDDIQANASRTADGTWYFNPGYIEAVDTDDKTGQHVFTEKLGIDKASTGMFIYGSENGKVGLTSSDGFTMKQGNLMAAAEFYDHSRQMCSAGLWLTSGDFVQEGGYVVTQGENGGDGIVIQQGDYILNGGDLHTQGYFKKHESDGRGLFITMIDGNWAIVGGGGTDYYGCGIVLNQGNFIQNAGTVQAFSANGGAGIVLNKGDYILNGGTLEIDNGSRGAEAGLASVLVDGDAYFGADSRLEITIDHSNETIGLMIVGGNVVIEEGAQAHLRMAMSVELEKGEDAKFTGTFLEIGDPYPETGAPEPAGTIEGEFEVSARDRLTMVFTANKSADGKRYEASFTRTAYVSELLKGNNARLAGIFEEFLPGKDYTTYMGLFDFYNRADASESSAEMNAVTRSLLPWQATEYFLSTMAQFDTSSRSMSRNLVLLQDADRSCDPCDFVEGCSSGDDPRHLWFAAHGNFGHYGAKSGSFGKLDVDSYGMNVGMARPVGKNSVLGIGFNYTNGDVNGDGSTDTDYDYYGFLASLRSKHPGRRIWTELSAGYAQAEFEQGRYDYKSARYDSSFDQNLVRLGVSVGRDLRRGKQRRLTPIAGLDYTFVHQQGYTEYERDGGNLGLRVGGDDIHSLRLRLGLETEIRRDRFRLSAHGFLRYEMLDRNANLDTRFLYAPSVRMTVRGQDYDRVSGITGLKLDWHWNDRTLLGAAYDLTVGDKYTEQWVDLSLRRSW